MINSQGKKEGKEVGIERPGNTACKDGIFVLFLSMKVTLRQL